MGTRPHYLFRSSPEKSRSALGTHPRFNKVNSRSLISVARKKSAPERYDKRVKFSYPQFRRRRRRSPRVALFPIL